MQCDISDGHRTEHDFCEGAYWVPIEGQWMQVPAHAIIRDRGEAVVWYVHHRGGIVMLFCAGRRGVKFDVRLRHRFSSLRALPLG